MKSKSTKPSHIKESEYVIPNHKFFQNSSELIDFLDQEDTSMRNVLIQKIDFKDFLNNKITFVLGEPGFGKSRLLQVLFEKITRNQSTFFVDLKSVKVDIQNHLNSFDRNFEKMDAIFLDALDEIHIDLISKRLYEVKRISLDFPKLKIIISCRTHHIKRHIQSLHNFTFSTVVLEHFQYHQIKEFLEKNCKNLQEDELNSLLEMVHSSTDFPFQQPQRVLFTPRYLNILAQLINKEGGKAILNLERNELFDKFINDRLKIESAKKAEAQESYRQKIPYIKQYLERLALIIEIQRSNKISKDNFVTFELDSQMNINNQILLEVFFDGTILKDRGEYLEFDNTEFQEYLAARAIIRLGNTEQVIFDLAIEQNLNAIYPTWYNVMSYIIELKPELLSPLVLFGTRAKENAFFELLNFVPKKYLNSSQSQKGEIFNCIFEYYCKNELLFNLGYEKSLTNFFVKEVNYSKVEECPKIINTSFQYFKACNSIAVLKELVSANWFEIRYQKHWKDILFFFIKRGFEFGDYLHRISLEALVKISNIEEFEKLTQDKSISKRALQKLPLLLSKKDPNHELTIQLICDDLFAPKHLFTPSIFNELTTTRGFINLFNYLLTAITNHPDPYYSFREKLDDELSSPDSPFYSNLHDIWNAEIESILIQVVIKFSFGVNTKTYSFHGNLLRVLEEKDDKIIFKILDALRLEEINDKNGWALGWLSNQLINLDNYESVIDIINRNFSETDLLKNLLRQSTIPKIRSLFSSYFPEMEARFKSDQERFSKDSKKREDEKKQRELVKKEKFKNCLEEGHSHVILDYNRMPDFYRSVLSLNQRNQLKAIILETLNSYDPSEATIKIISQEKGNSKKIFTSNFVRYYREAVELTDEFEIDITPFRKKILTLIPFLFHETKWVLEKVKNPSKEEIQFFVNWFINREKDEFQQYGLNHFLEICKELELKENINFIESFLRTKKLGYYKRADIYDLIFDWDIKELDFFMEEFEIYKDAEEWSDDYKIAIKINEYLLRRQNKIAFEWRKEQTIKHKYLQKKLHSSSFRFRGVQNPEGIGNAFQYITDEKFKGDFLILLEESFKILTENPDYETFVSNEIWNVVIGYFKFLKTKKTEQKRNLDLLWNLFEKYSSNFEVKNFEYKINQVRSEYIAYLGEPEPFFNCVKRFNEIKSKKYLEIAYPQNLFDSISQVINNNLRKWVEQGGYGLIKNMPKIEGKKREREKVIQKTIVTQLENYLLKEGLRNSDIRLNFYREVEKLNNDKVDLIITYGSIGAVMIEIKLAYNLGNDEKYKANKFIPYMEETECDYGIFLIFRIDDSNKNFTSKLQELQVIYPENNIEIIGIDCVK